MQWLKLKWQHVTVVDIGFWMSLGFWIDDRWHRRFDLTNTDISWMMFFVIFGYLRRIETLLEARKPYTPPRLRVIAHEALTPAQHTWAAEERRKRAP